MFRRGITLLDLLIALVVIGILASITVPAYRQHVRRVHRVDATAALHDLLAAQERFHLRHGAYSANLAAAPPAGLGVDVITPGGRYSLEAALSADGQSFIATATPTREGGQAGDVECLALSVDQRGRRAVSGSGDSASCWRQGP
jgi:type IV pilus assembly protein PilE